MTNSLRAMIRGVVAWAAVAGGVWAAEGDFYTPERDRLTHAVEAGVARQGEVNVLLIGDSIMGGYFKGVQKELAKEANVVRHPGNAGDTRNGLEHIDEWLGDTRWDVIHFNWGLHDLCHRHPDSKEQGRRDKVRGSISVPLDEYERNLEALVERLEKTGATLIFATTTKVPEGEPGRHAGDEARYNEAALRVMKRHGIPIDDLHAVSAGFSPAMFSKPGDVHFSGGGCTALAREVAAAIRRHRRAARSADVIVYGATPAGVCAAIGAKREGASVLLVEPTAHVGGVNTGGLAFSDSNQMDRTALRGLFEEFHERIEADYRGRGVRLPYSVATKDQRPWTYEPHVAARVTRALLEEARVPVLTGQAIARVEKAGARIMSLTTVGGGVFTARTFVDATYEGDLHVAARVTWVLGREGRKEFGESLAGRQYPKPPMAISGLDADGDLLPLVTTQDAGADEDGDRNVMTYSFRLCLTAKAENRVPFPQPDTYDPARFEVVRRYLAQEKKPAASSIIPPRTTRSRWCRSPSTRMTADGSPAATAR